MNVYQTEGKLYTSAEKAVYAALKAAEAIDYYDGEEIANAVRAAQRNCTIITNYNGGEDVMVEKVEVL